MWRLRYGCRCGEGDGPPKHMASLIRVVSASAADRPTYSDLTRRRHVHSGRARGAPCNCMLKSMHRRAPGSSTTHTHTHIRSASPVALQLHVDLCRSQTIHGDAIARLGEMAPTGLYSAQKWDPATIRDVDFGLLLERLAVALQHATGQRFTIFAVCDNYNLK